jgi:Pro-kumamolisin, activation domain
MPHQEGAAFPTRPRREHRSASYLLTRAGSRRWPSRLIAVLITVGLATAVPATAQAAAPSDPAVAAAPRTVPPAGLPHGATDVGSLDGATVLDLTVTLDPRDPAGLDAFVAGVTTPGSPSYHHYLTPAEFGTRFGADAATVARVADELRATGLRPGPPDADMLSIPVEATAAEAGTAFGTRFARTRLADGRVGHRHTTAATIPAGAAGIAGLDNWPRSRHGGATTRDAAASLSTACPSGGAVPGAWSAAQLASAYGLSSLAGVNGGTGQTVALYELSDYADGDVTAFQNCLGAHPSVTRVKVDGGTSDTSGAGEVMLDADIVMGLVPNASILVYVAPNTASGALDEYRAIVNDNRAQVISVSWGLCEADEGGSDARAENNLFRQAAAQGQTVFAASGDDGSADCYAADGTTGLAVDDPASQPYVTGVGGTSLTAVGPRQESVWNSNGSGGGGGVSQLWSLPSYQNTVHVPASSPCGATGGCRQVPDVAASADPYHGYSVYCSVRSACGTGGWLVFGGTSGAAPLWAAATSLLNEKCGPSQRIGFANPALYSAAGALHDVTSGNNDAIGVNGGSYAATAGYDLATGLGTPDVAALASALCSDSTSTTVTTTPVATVSPVTGSYGTVTVGSSAAAATFTVANTGTGPLSVAAVAVSGADAADFPVTGDTCTAVTLPALGTCSVAVAFRPSGARPEAASLTVTSNSAAPLVPVALVGSGVNPAVDPPITTGTPAGYWMLTADGRVYPFGDALSYGDSAAALAPLMAGGVRATKLEPTPTGHGYWIVDSAGHVGAFGDARDLGGVPAGQLRPAERVTSLSSTPSGAGYWLFTDQGRVFGYGDAPFLGDMSTTKLNGPILGSIPSTSGHGYYLVGSDGGIFAFGDAAFRGSMGGTHLNAPVESLVPTTDDGGYWLVAGDGGIFAFGDATFHGSMGGTHLNAPVSGMVRFGNGYLMVATDGGIFDFSDRPFFGSLAGTPLAQPVVTVGSLDR